MPPGSEFALDLAAWEVGPRFMGMAGVPAGVHVLASAPSAATPRMARLVSLAPGQVLVARWDPREERLLRGGELDEDDVARLAAAHARGELDAQMARYAGDVNAAWPALTAHLDREVVARIEPAAVGLTIAPAPPPADAPHGCGGGGRAPRPLAGDAGMQVDEGGSAPAVGASLDSWHRAAMGVDAPPDPAAPAGVAPPDPTAALSTDPRVRALRAEVDAGLAADERSQGRMFYTSLAGVGRGSAPAQRTQHAIDTSASLHAALAGLAAQLAGGTSGGGGRVAVAMGGDEDSDAAASAARHLLGELQGAFALFLVGHAQSGMRQWALLADAVMRADDAAREACARACGSGGAPPPRFPLLSAGAGGGLIADALECLARQLPLLPAELVLGEAPAPLPGGGAGPAPAPHAGSGSGVFLRRAAAELGATLAAVVAQRAGAGRAAAPDNACGRYVAAARRLLDVCRERYGWELPLPAAPEGAGGRGRSPGDGEAPTRAFATREALLAALAAEGGDDDLPVIVEE